MHPIADQLPELRKSKNPEENKNRRDLVRARLLARNPGSPEDWLERYEERYRRLCDVSDDFRELVDADPTDENLRRIQEALDEIAA